MFSKVVYNLLRFSRIFAENCLIEFISEIFVGSFGMGFLKENLLGKFSNCICTKGILPENCLIEFPNEMFEANRRVEFLKRIVEYHF